METKQFAIAGAQSNIEWTGKKVSGAHNGTIGIKEGTLTFNNQQLTGGKFTIDVAAIRILDVTDPATNTQFAGHLASDDFFSTDKYPTASFAITGAVQQADNQYHIEGDLTIKGITHPVGFDAAVALQGDTLTATGKMIVDRTKYDIKFRSGNFFQNLGDTLIYNDFELNIFLTAKAV